MSYHIQPSIEAEKQLRAQRHRSVLLSLIIAILGCVLVGLVLAYILIAPTLFPTEPIVTYRGPNVVEEEIQQKTVNPTRQSRPAAASMSAAKVITSNAPAPTAIPVPEIDTAVESTTFGSGDDFGAGWSGAGEAGEGGNGGIFGRLSGSGLKGTFYDLKQSPEQEPTSMGLQDFETGSNFDTDAQVNRNYDENVATIVRRNLSENAFSDFFKAPKQLVLTQLYVPRVVAAEAPEAFKISDIVKGRRWVIAYSGTVIAPESGRYRFVGFADDVLIVLENNRVILDGSLLSPLDDADDREFIDQEHTVGGWHSYQGDWLVVDKGEELDLQILTGERPGGHYSGYLLIEKDGETYEKDAGGAPLLPLFKTESGEQPELGHTLPPLAPETSWSIWRAKS